MSLTNYKVIKLSHGDNIEKKRDDCIEREKYDKCLLWEKCVVN